jgi:hypothetical protein
MRSKTLVALAAMLCLLATGDAAASAANYFPTSTPGPEQPFEVKGSGEATFTGGEFSVKCSESVYSGTTPPKTGSAIQKVVPTLKGCKTNLGATVGFTNEHCAVEFYGQELISPGVYAEFTGFVENGGTCHLKFSIIFGEEKCEVIVQSQKELKGSKQTDLEPAGITINAALVGIAYKVNSVCERLGVTGGSEGKFSDSGKTGALFIK